MDWLQYIGSIGGITGIMAVLMWLAYRQDRKYTEARFSQIISQYEKRFSELCADYKGVVGDNTEAKVKMTVALNELTAVLRASNGRH